MQIRPATFDDAAALAAIYGHNALHGTGTFEEAAPTAGEMAQRMHRVIDAGWPWLVAEEDGDVLGFAYAAQFRDRSAYRYCCENSVYIAPDAQGRGVGTALMEALITVAKAYGFTTMLAIIGDSANAGSIALHTRFGFEPIGTMRAVGFKFGRWLDVVTMQRDLTD